MSDIRYDGRVAIITGAGGGLGKTYALMLAKRGAKVVVNDLGGGVDGSGGSTGPAQEVVDEITAMGGEAVANTDNVADFAGAERLVQTALDRFGRLDVLVNNAGILRDRMSFSMSEEEWDAVIAVVLKGHFCPTRFAVEHWRNRSKELEGPVGASIVNTASESGLYGNAGQLNYAAAKAGIAAMTIALAREMQRYGVRANGIAPVARTRLTAPLMGEHGAEGLDPLDPDGIAPLVAWLASDRAADVTGQIFKVQANLIQTMQGWRPLTQLETDEGWTIDGIEERRRELFARSDPGLPPFMPPVA